jgi:NADH dehydrogenase FAD-containing subunit
LITSAFSKHSQIQLQLQSQHSLFASHQNLFEAENLIAWLERNVPCDKKTSLALATVFLQRHYFLDFQNQSNCSAFLSHEMYLYKVIRKPRVVIIGGGFSGVNVAYVYLLYSNNVQQNVRNQLKSRFDVFLIDKRNSFEYIMDYPLLCVNPSEFKKLTYPYSKIGNVHFIQNHVKMVTPSHVVLNASDGATVHVSFDYLVVATGSRCSVPFMIHNNSMQNIVLAYSSKSILQNFAKYQHCKTMAVIGAGPTGIEIAGELANCYKDSTIVLISRQSQFLQHAGNIKLHATVSKHFNAYPNLKCLFNHQVIEIKDNMIYAIDKETMQPLDIIKADISFICCGISPRTELFSNHMFDSIDADKYVRVNNHLQMFKSGGNQKTYYPNIFAVGDIVNLQEYVMLFFCNIIGIQ